MFLAVVAKEPPYRSRIACPWFRSLTLTQEEGTALGNSAAKPNLERGHPAPSGFGSKTRLWRAGGCVSAEGAAIRRRFPSWYSELESARILVENLSLSAVDSRPTDRRRYREVDLHLDKSLVRNEPLSIVLVLDEVHLPVGLCLVLVILERAMGKESVFTFVQYGQ